MAELKFPVTELEKDKFQVKVDMALYAKESLAAACYKLTDRFYVHQQTDGENIVVVFESKDGNTITEETVKQFCNELIDQQVLALQHLFNSFLPYSDLNSRCSPSKQTDINAGLLIFSTKVGDSAENTKRFQVV